jgi:hypothetical protein
MRAMAAVLNQMEGDLDTQLKELHKVGITRYNVVHRSIGSSVMFRQR